MNTQHQLNAPLVTLGMALTVLLLGATACGQAEKKPKTARLEQRDELKFPTRGNELITLDEIPDGTFSLKRVDTFTHSKGFNRVLYKLVLEVPGKPNRKKDELTVLSRWDDTNSEGGFVSMSGAVPLHAIIEDGLLDLRTYKLFKMESAVGEIPSYSIEELPGDQNDRGQYSILFSELATRDGKVYSAAGIRGTIELSKKELIFHTESKSKTYSVVTRFVFSKK